jgi:hypothetical protein
MSAASFFNQSNKRDFQMSKPTNSLGMHKPNLNPVNVEQVSEYRRTTNRGTEPQPPRAAQFRKGASNIEQIREATDARRRQSNSSDRYTGPRSPANRDYSK